jgi:hypothetical protein
MEKGAGPQHRLRVFISLRRSSVAIYSALNFFFGMTSATNQVQFLTTLGLKKPGQISSRVEVDCAIRLAAKVAA